MGSTTGILITWVPFLFLGLSTFTTPCTSFLPAWHRCQIVGPIRIFNHEIQDNFSTALHLSAAQGKKKRRRRKDLKQPPGSIAPDPVKVSQEQLEGADLRDDDDDEDDTDDMDNGTEVVEATGFDLKQDDIAKATLKTTGKPPTTKRDGNAGDEGGNDLNSIRDVAKFEFKNSEILKGIQDDLTKSSSTTSPVVESTNSAIPLPDIKEARTKKMIEEELARMEQEKLMSKPKIKRSDKEAFTKLLEQQPFADADDSFFEEEEYSVVSALLGERAKPFLSIPTGPLQVGHFIGALGIMLMAFIEYPGFPLTNFPTPVREALQGGLATVYSINLALSVVAAFKAKERGQPIPLWVAKTFTVGGLAFDQLTQLPTLEDIAKAKSVKGARAIKTRKG